MTVEAKGDSCSFRHEDSVERKHNRPLLLWDRRHELTEEDLRKETLPGEASKEILRIRHVIIGILPHVKITKLNRDACTRAH